jgi:hypothetical protein|tara:strand:- start:272 stop:382 length:111 start_codon:yes stop_codon:yes gene_type:complete
MSGLGWMIGIFVILMFPKLILGIVVACAAFLFGATF